MSVSNVRITTLNATGKRWNSLQRVNGKRNLSRVVANHLHANQDQTMKVAAFNLPWPPSVNHYWRMANGRIYVSAEGKRYRSDVYFAVKQAKQCNFVDGERIGIKITTFPPDRRKRDLDNVLKALLDALQYACVYSDDSQIDRLQIDRKIGEIKGQVGVIVYKVDAV